MAGNKETLREKAVKKLHSPDANPSQLGDPISLKAETSPHVPTNEEKGATVSSSSSSSGQNKDGSPYAPPLPPPPSYEQNWDSNAPSKQRELENKKSKDDGEKKKKNGGDGETLREKAVKKLKGPDANPSQLGDPISLKAEASDTVPTPDEEGAHGGNGEKKGKRDSKL
ncbi:hypothetical protein MN608_04374 [Microdochium nivale]|nr:hypothetical protein MN608_04374 [Microdochium nivale]